MDNTLPKKKKGPIRFEAIVPFFAIVGVIILYFVLFFDTHLRKGIEWGATQGNGAEVNVGFLHSSFLKGTFEMGAIEVTNPKEPTKNRFEVGKVGLGLLWDGLLRAKLVVENAGITGIEVNTSRKNPGRVLPPPSEASASSKMIAMAKEQLSKSSLGDIAKLLEGMDPTQGLKDLGELKSAQRAQQLKSDLAKKENDWKNNLNAIPGEKDFAALQAKIGSLSAQVSNPAEIPQRVSQAKSVVDEVQGKVNSVKSMGDALAGDVTGFGSSIGEIDDLMKKDREELESKLKLPKLDAKSIAEQLFGPMVLDKVGRVEGYINMARAYMPPKKKGEAAPKPAPRAKGRIYEFPVLGHSYPRFWVKRAEISSTGGNSAFGGDVSGALLDASSNQAQVGRPMILDIRGDFAKQEVRSVLAKITIDHRTEDPIESLKASIGAYPVPAQNFSDSEAIKFGVGKATGATELEGSIRGGEFSIISSNRFSQVDYQVAAQSKLLEATLKSVVSELPTFDIQAKVWGTLLAPKIAISSNLAAAIERGFAKQLQAKLAEARKKLDELIQSKVGNTKKELVARYDQARSQVFSQVESRKKQAEAVHAQAQAKLNEITSRASAPQQKALDQIKKKLPFGR